MNNKEFKISGTGCALVDYLYQPVSFTGEIFRRYQSQRPGDGGLFPGKLVFKDDFERFSDEGYLQVRGQMTQGRPPVTLNVGGPSIVSLIHTAQMLEGFPVKVVFYGSKGRDEGASYLDEQLKRTPLQIGTYKISEQYTPFTDVLSDPDYDHGHGERVFINNIGAAWDLYPEDLDDAFFESDMVVFGGTALVPHIHKSLLELLRKAKEKGSITVVNTVYDSLNEQKNPGKAWPLGASPETYQSIDLLITDMEEALCLSGQTTIDDALSFFKKSGVGAVIVTYGAQPLYYFSDSPLFGVSKGMRPVSEKVCKALQESTERTGDTTGCGDNFAGGVIASVAHQRINRPHKQVDLDEAIALGTASGGYACFYYGGTFYEEYAGQKRDLIAPYYEEYLQQIQHLPE
jgi:sugar/nucleoside kinase (ribokinase family)